MMETMHNSEAEKTDVILLFRYRPFYESGIILPNEDSPVSIDEALESMFYTEYIAKDEKGFFMVDIELEKMTGSESSVENLITIHKVDRTKLESILHFNHAVDKLTNRAVKEFIAEYRAMKRLQEVIRTAKQSI